MKPKDYLLDTNIWIGYVKHDSALFDRVDDALASGRTYMSLITEGGINFRGVQIPKLGTELSAHQRFVTTNKDHLFK